MKFKEFIKSSFVLVGFSAAGKREEDIVYPIPRLWEKSRKFISERDAKKLLEFACHQEIITLLLYLWNGNGLRRLS